MLPLQLAGLALAGRTLYTKNRGTQKNSAGTRTDIKKYKLRSGSPNFPQIRMPQLKLPQLNLPKLNISKSTADSFFRSLTSAVSSLGKSFAKEDFSNEVKPFIPVGARLLKPQYPADSAEVLSADLDGDSRNELVASYSYGAGIRTIVLKRLSEGWYKADEIDSPGLEAIKYRNAADITGEGKKQLLLGFPDREKSTLHGYTLDRDMITRLFSRNFNRFELLESKAESKERKQAHLAIWNRLQNGEYNVDLLRWNGLELENVKNIQGYYSEKVVPYQARLVKGNPQLPAAWYNLARSLEISGAKQEADQAARMGMSMDKKSEYRDKFTDLRQRVRK